MNPKRLLKDIRSVHVQGAENIAKKALSLIREEAKKETVEHLVHLKNDLIKARPTEPCLRNSMKFIFTNTKDNDELIGKCEKALRHFTESDRRISEIGAKKIQSRAVVFTHCHSSSVIGVLKHAKIQRRKFEVFCTETRPLFQGRKTASDMIKFHIPTTLFVDSAMKVALRKVDLCLIGCDVMTTEGKVINKIGSEIIAEICDHYDIPLYCCTNSWKFDPESILGHEEVIEERSSKEVWDKSLKGLKVRNPAFEHIRPDLITGIISEIGIYKPSVFVEELKLDCPWMFK